MGGEVEASEREKRECAAGKGARPAIGRFRLLQLAPQLVHAADPFPHVARVGVEVARLRERGERAVQVPLSQAKLSATDESVLAPDGRRIVAAVERAAGVERVGGALEVPEIAVATREVKEDLYLDAAPALPLLGRCLVQMTRARASASTASRGRWSFSRQ